VLYVRQRDCATGSQIACNDDTGSCMTSEPNDHHGSRVQPTVTAGETYFIVVDGYRSSGPFTLRVLPPPVVSASATAVATVTPAPAPTRTALPTIAATGTAIRTSTPVATATRLPTATDVSTSTVSRVLQRAGVQMQARVTRSPAKTRTVGKNVGRASAQ